MKHCLLKSFALAALTLLATTASAFPLNPQHSAINSQPSTLTPTADTWVRTDNTGGKYATQTKLEVKDYVNADEGKDVKFYGVITFALNKPEGYAVKSARLRLTTERIKTNRPTCIYLMRTDRSEGDLNFNAVSDAVATALNGPSVEFMAEGQNGKSVALDEVDAEKYQNIAAWQNSVDVTALTRQLLPTEQTVTFLVAAAAPSDKNNNSNCFFTKEQEDFNNAKTAALGTVSAADVVPQLVVEYEEDTDTKTASLQPTYDSTCRPTANGKYGSDATMEIKNNTDFVALMLFDLPADVLDRDNYELQSALLRLTFERVKGGRAMELYPYGEDFNETDGLGHTDENNGTRKRTEAAIAAAKEAGTIVAFDANGTSKALTVDEVPEAYRDITKWQNTLDLTDYVKTLTEPTMRLMLAAAEGSTDAKKIFSKDADDFANSKDASLMFLKHDLVPTLTLVYRKTGDDTGISDAQRLKNNETKNAAVYDLQGRRMTSSAVLKSGLYIIGGKKVLVK